MIRRPGVVVATVFALGALLGLATSSVFLRVDASEVRSEVETRTSALPGPVADALLAALDDRDVFGRVAEDLRADQLRNLRVAVALAAVMAVGLGVAFRRRDPEGSSKGQSGVG